MPQTIVPNMTDLQNWVEWDELTTAGAGNTAALYAFFTVPAGGAKGKAATSLTEVRKLTSPEVMNVVSMGFYFAPQMDPIDIATFLDTYYCEFWIGNSKTFAEGPLWVYPAGGGMTGVSVVAAQQAWGIGVPNPLAVYDFRVPPPIGDGVTGIYIGDGESFEVRVIGTPFLLIANLRIKCLLRGIKGRAVR